MCLKPQMLKEGDLGYSGYGNCQYKPEIAQFKFKKLPAVKMMITSCAYLVIQISCPNTKVMFKLLVLTSTPHSC